MIGSTSVIIPKRDTIFDHPELCEDADGECPFLFGGYCKYADEILLGLDDQMYYHVKHKKCIELYNRR